MKLLGGFISFAIDQITPLVLLWFFRHLVVVGWLFRVSWPFETVSQSTLGRLLERGRKGREKTDERKNAQTTPTRTHHKSSRPPPHHHPNKKVAPASEVVYTAPPHYPTTRSPPPPPISCLICMSTFSGLNASVGLFCGCDSFVWVDGSLFLV